MTAYHRFAGSDFVLQFWRCVEIVNLPPSSRFLSCHTWKNGVTKPVNNRSLMGEAGVVGLLSLMSSRAKAGIAGLDARKALSGAGAVGTSLSPVGVYPWWVLGAVFFSPTRIWGPRPWPEPEAHWESDLLRIQTLKSTTFFLSRKFEHLGSRPCSESGAFRRLDSLWERTRLTSKAFIFWNTNVQWTVIGWLCVCKKKRYRIGPIRKEQRAFKPGRGGTTKPVIRDPI